MSRLIIITLLIVKLLFAADEIKGIIYDINTKEPIVGATVYYINGKKGTTTNLNGEFTLQKIKNTPLIISAVGYYTDTLYSVENNFSLGLQPKTENLKTIVVLGERFGEYGDFNAVHRKAVITEKELKKAACCNLSESFETNSSIDVTFTDAITGIKQLEFMGVGGANILTTKENIPYLRGLLSNVGPSYIPGPWLKSISYSKDVGSVINGYEALTGGIDLQMLESHDHDSKDLFLNLYANNEGRYEFNTSYKYEIDHELTGITFLHRSYRNKKMDSNSDDFMDMPTYNNFNLMQKFQILVGSFEINTGFHYLKDDKNGGTINKNTFKYSSNNELFSAFGKIGFIWPDGENSTGLQIQFLNYKNSSQYGIKDYSGSMKSLYLNLINNVELSDDILKANFGFSALFDKYDEKFISNSYLRDDYSYGSFLELVGNITDELNYIAGIRYDYHNHYKNFITPKIHFRYQFNDDIVLRAGYGEGFRIVNIFTEFSQTFVSNKNIILKQKDNYGYGLGYDKTSNIGASLSYDFTFNYYDANLTIDYFYTKFNYGTVLDLSTSNNIIFENIKNGIYTNTFQVELTFVPFLRVETKLAYRYLNTKQKINGEYEQKYMIPKNRYLLTMSYATEKSTSSNFNLQYDLNIKYFGKKKLPANPSNNLNDYSPDFALINAQITLNYKTLQFYLGGENLNNFTQKNPIIDYENPNSPNFDASIIWGPIFGRVVYTGVRYYL